MPSFLVVFTGQYLEGRAPMDVEAAMSDALNLSLPQREKIFSGKPIVLKRTNDKAAALSLGQQLKAFGADIRVKIEQDDAAESTQGSNEAEQVNASNPSRSPLDNVSKQEGETADSNQDSGGLSLAAQEGFIVTPLAPAESPVADLSHLDVLEVDAGPLPTTLQERREVDTSNLSLRDNDGRSLIDENTTDAEPVVAPDFGLDAPGAILPTLDSPQPVEVPDTSRLTIREDAGNLVDPNELERSEPVTVKIDHLSMD
jgi:hypothetical protein